MTYPRMFRLRQVFDAPRVDDVPGAVRSEIQKMKPAGKIKVGQSVAITGGSRGVANIDVVIREIASEMKALGAHPYVVPAMGSHGGGTAEGQAGVLASYGITEDRVGAPIRSSMEVIEIGMTDFGMPVFFDKWASEADHVIVVNRVKPHTGFVGEIESGLMKMMLIGLGKHHGASIYHRAIIHHSFDKIVRVVGKMVLEKMPIAFGVALLENGYDETAQVTAVRAAEFEEVEKGLQKQAKAWCPKLPFNEVDLLIVDEMGKDISGSGMDTNVVGRKGSLGKSDVKDALQVLRIFVRGLTDKTHGNAVGIGLADFTTDRLVNEIDLQSTYINAITGQAYQAGVIPMHYPTDREIMDIAMESIGLVPPEDARVVWIKNTLDLGEVEVSEAYLEATRSREDLEITRDPKDLTVGADGNLPLFDDFGA